MVWPVEILKIWTEEQLLIKYYTITFDVAKNPKHDRYQCGLVSMIYKFFDKKASRGTATNEIYLIKN